MSAEPFDRLRTAPVEALLVVAALDMLRGPSTCGLACRSESSGNAQRAHVHLTGCS
jgi:hypothetical protein